MYRYGDREQMTLFPASVEDYVPKDAPVRAYDAIVDAFDLKELGIKMDPQSVGHPQYDPRAMLKLFIYGMAYGVRSSRKLEREVHYNVSFIWLMGQLKPDHKTIAEFRRNNKTALRALLKHTARLCLKLDLIDGNTLFIDGSKIRANAGIKNTWTKARCEDALKRIDARIDAILSECESVDQGEDNSRSWVGMDKELVDQNVLKAKVETILKELKDENKSQVNTTDRDCAKMSSTKGTHASYNAQISVDQKYGLIAAIDVVNENNDLNQLASQVKGAEDNLGKRAQAVAADAGYSNTDKMQEVDQKNIVVIVPSQKQAAGQEPGEFDKERFAFDQKHNGYLCPAKQRLSFVRPNKSKKYDVYQVPDGHTCRCCSHWGRCTKNSNGRMIARYWNEALRRKFEAQYLQPQAQAIYKLRKQKAELPFGHVKRNLKFDAFLLRGLQGVKAEFSLAASCFNMVRMITLLGVETIVTGLKVA